MVRYIDYEKLESQGPYLYMYIRDMIADVEAEEFQFADNCTVVLSKNTDGTLKQVETH